MYISNTSVLYLYILQKILSPFYRLEKLKFIRLNEIDKATKIISE